MKQVSLYLHPQFYTLGVTTVTSLVGVLLTLFLCIYRYLGTHIHTQAKSTPFT